MTKYVGVLGTHGWTKDPTRSWWPAGSPFNLFLEQQGIVMARPVRPFCWSGDIDGVPMIANGNDWEAGAVALLYYLEHLPYEDRNLIAHSHGGQVALMAAHKGMAIRSLILIGTPVRDEIEAIAPAALSTIGCCLHLCDARFDFMGFAGALLDWRFSLRRTFTVPGIDSRRVKGIGHSGLLYDPTKFPLWASEGWLDVLRADRHVPAV